MRRGTRKKTTPPNAISATLSLPSHVRAPNLQATHKHTHRGSPIVSSSATTPHTTTQAQPLLLEPSKPPSITPTSQRPPTKSVTTAVTPPQAGSAPRSPSLPATDADLVLHTIGVHIPANHNTHRWKWMAPGRKNPINDTAVAPVMEMT
jgi:hypothetical protein